MTSTVKHPLKVFICILDEGLVEEDKVVPVPTNKAYWPSGNIAPLFPNLGPGWRRAVILATRPIYRR